MSFLIDDLAVFENTKGVKNGIHFIESAGGLGGQMSQVFEVERGFCGFGFRDVGLF